ncbi:hypothetical protein [Heyndrickxia coagulans]|uniref:hypothetical protein n=1 Tax=Heyndrickxia coagulans TaxID=1398 RepID=UPI0018A6F8B0|nr:hypothetical protein [Heyndrickxia coagulans]MBF8417254.1 hypothetical protein [Heyndrickxia coagulans]
MKISVTTLVEDLFQILIALFIILESNSALAVAVGMDNRIREILLIILYLYIFYLVVKNFKKGIKINKFLYAIGLIIYCLIYILFHINDFPSGNKLFVYYFILLLLGFYFLCMFGNKNVVSKILINYSYIIVILSIISLFFFIFGTNLQLIHPSGQLLYDWGTKHYINSYYKLYFETQSVTIGGFTFMRNTGIFTEAPMHALHLIYTTILLLYFRKRKSLIIIILATMLTTISSTGIISEILIISFLIMTKKYNNLVEYLKPIIIIAAIIASTYSIITLFLSKTTTGSYSIRLDDFHAGFLAWVEHPFIGNGFGNRSVIIKYMSNFRATNNGMANAIMTIASDGGLILSLIFLVAISLMLYRLLKLKIDTKFQLIFLVIFIILLITTVYQYTSLMMMTLALIFYGYDFSSLRLTKIMKEK